MNIICYNEGTEINTREIARYLERKLVKARVEVKASPFQGSSENVVTDLARRIASIKIPRIDQKLSPDSAPLRAEIEFERRKILGQAKASGVIYDGFNLVRIFSGTIKREEHGPEFIHIVFTNRLFATWDDQNQRYHLRTSVYAIPSVISITGLIEAPARPREYYLLRQQYERLGRDPAEVKNSFKNRFLDYDDECLTEVAKGYAMQAVFYHQTGEPFCNDRGCRLYNAHWQEELIYAQLQSGYEFCPGHADLINKFTASPMPAQ